MKPPLVSRGVRGEFLRELRAVRSCDCSWPRPDGSRPRCGRCVGCDTDGIVSRGGARLH